MSAALKLIEGLASASPTLHVVIRLDDDDKSNILLAPHSNVNDVISLPANYIQSALKHGELRGLGPEYQSVDLSFKNEFADSLVVAEALARIGVDAARPNPVYCYDENNNPIRCPDT